MKWTNILDQFSAIRDKGLDVHRATTLGENSKKQNLHIYKITPVREIKRTFTENDTTHSVKTHTNKNIDIKQKRMVANEGGRRM